MLCTRMRLVERRISIPREATTVTAPEGATVSSSVEYNGNNNDDHRHLQNDINLPGVTRRPCLLRNLADNCSGAEILTPRIIVDRRITKRSTKRVKPPLMIFSLNMQPGIKTLVQDEIKRDPRKLPTFCGQYKNVKRSRRTPNESSDGGDTMGGRKKDIVENDLVIKGDGIISRLRSNANFNKNISITEDDDDEDESKEFPENYVPRELQIQLTECCQCIKDLHKLRANSGNDEDEIDVPHSPEIESCRFLRTGNNNKTETAKSPRGTTEETKPMVETMARPVDFFLKRAPTPRTGQVIRITMNSKN